MSLVETFHRAKLERQLRFAQAAMRHMEKKATAPAPVVKIVVKPPPAPVEEPKPDTTWVQRQVERFKAPWFEITDGPTSFESKDKRPPEIKTIQRIVGRHFLISVADILAERRTKDVVRPRQIAMYLCKELTMRSLPEIGRRFGGRDHTTVLHAVRKIAIAIGRDPLLAEEVATIRQKCEAA